MKKKRWIITIVTCFLGLLLFLAVSKYIPTSIKEYQQTKEERKRALAADHWVYNDSGRRYVYADGTVPKDKWLKVGEQDYHFTKEGYMSTGWVKTKNIHYYLKPNGQRQTGWLQENNNWYYLKEDGSMATGWIKTADAYYFLNADGSMATGWVTDQGKQYYLTENGSMATGWMESDGNTYYLQENGAMATGWLDWENHRYYLRSDGVMSIGWIEDGMTSYFMNADGTLAMNTWAEQGDSHVYLREDGTIATGWLELEGGTYYFHENGTPMVDWQEIDNIWYYFHEDGIMATGWIIDSTGNSYFLKSNGEWDPAAQKEMPPAVQIPPGTGPLVALTFDDGPGKYTDGILNVLQANGAKATFFMLGQLVSHYPDVVKKMAAIGCELGNHSYDHANLAKMDAAGIESQLAFTNQELTALVGYGARCVRPPYGAYNATVRDAAASPLILWSIDTLDWKTLNAQSTIDTVLSTVKDGDVILMHDIHEQSAVAINTLVPALKQLGYRLVTVSELAAAKGKVLENGAAYGAIR